MAEQAVEQDKRAQYIAQRDGFRVVKRGLVLQIESHESAIRELKEKIEHERPRTEHGEMVCKTCDCVSMKYGGRTSKGGLTGGDDYYECEICGRDDLSDY